MSFQFSTNRGGPRWTCQLSGCMRTLRKGREHRERGVLSVGSVSKNSNAVVDEVGVKEGRETLIGV